MGARLQITSGGLNESIRNLKRRRLYRVAVTYAVIEGSLRRDDDSVRVTIQLIDVADGFNVWSETYSHRLDDILALQTDIAGSVVDALELDVATLDQARK